MLYGYLNSPFVSNAFSDAAIPPSNLTSPVISGSGVVGQTLSTTNGTWSGTLPITYSYQWNRNGSIIVGATFNTYTLVTADASNSITCTVTATNVGGFASSTSNAISVASAGDADANAFIAAAAITDATQKAAIDKLVVDLKGYGIWTKMKAIYPFCGGTSSQHKYNLKDPRDLDAAYRLVFFGGWTHSSGGAKPNGTNGYADTKLNVNSVLGLNDAALSFYSRENIDTAVLIGVGWDAATTMISPSFGGGLGDYSAINSAGSGAGVVNRTGLFTVTRLSSANYIGYRNGIQYFNRAVVSTSKPNYNVFIGARNGANSTGGQPTQYSQVQSAMASIGDGLTDTEAANYYTAVQTFQTTLGRNV